MDKDGGISYVGRFDENRSKFFSFIVWNMKKSRVLSKLFDRRNYINKDDIRIFIRIIHKSKILLAENYPRSEFHMILWDQQFGQFFRGVAA